MTFKTAISTSNPPFAVPPVIVFDLPAPPSINRVRRVDWKFQKMVDRWKREAGGFVLLQRRGQPRKVYGPYELLIVMSEAHMRMDLDNGVKSIIDYLQRIDAVEGDDQPRLRKLTVEWGDAPQGCRVHIRAISVSDHPSAVDAGAGEAVRTRGTA